MSQSEHKEQCILISWAKNSGDWRLRWLHSIPNGLKLTQGQAVKAKKEGLTRGILDCFLPFPTSTYAGLYVEMKTRAGRLSDVQKEFKGYCEKVGYKVTVCRSGVEAIQEVIKYVKETK